MTFEKVVKRGSSRTVGLCAFGILLLYGSCAFAGAVSQDQGEPAPLKLSLTRQLSLADVEGGKLHAQVQPRQRAVGQRVGVVAHEHANSPKAQGAQGGPDGVAFFPGDLSYQGGAVVTEAENHDVYVNCDASCFGFPATFLYRLGESNFIHVTDDYVGARGSHRYTVGRGGIINIPVSGPIGPDEIVTLAYIAGSAFGTGYGHIYHLFFAPGIDVCADSKLTVCYSPDNPATFVFCAFHASVTFPDIGHVLFTVQPYANIPSTATEGGCQVNQPSPNAPEVDSQANVLSHELFETITDPDGSGWWNTNDLALFGSEIGDECAQSEFKYAPAIIHGHAYEVQPEYSNDAHACVFRPK